MKDEQNEVVRDFLEPYLVQNIQVFLGFANLSWCFI